MCRGGQQVILMCNECYTLWIDPLRTEVSDQISPPLGGSDEPGVGCKPEREATLDEVRAAGFDKYVQGEFNL